MILAKGILYTTASVGLLAMYANGGMANPFFVLVHCALFALGVMYLVRAAKERR